MNKFVALLLAVIMPTQAFATECQAPVKLLEEGSPAPCRGYLFSPDKELEIRIKSKEHSLLQEEISYLSKVVDNMKKKESESDKILELEAKKTELWKSRAEDLAIKFTEVRERQDRRDAVFVLLGIGLTVLAGWGLGQAAAGR